MNLSVSTILVCSNGSVSYQSFLTSIEGSSRPSLYKRPFDAQATKPVSPDALSWIATDPVGASWTFGEPAIDESGIYVRSQRDLVRITP